MPFIININNNNKKGVKSYNNPEIFFFDLYIFISSNCSQGHKSSQKIYCAFALNNLVLFPILTILVTEALEFCHVDGSEFVTAGYSYLYKL